MKVPCIYIRWLKIVFFSLIPGVNLSPSLIHIRSWLQNISIKLLYQLSICIVLHMLLFTLVSCVHVIYIETDKLGRPMYGNLHLTVYTWTTLYFRLIWIILSCCNITTGHHLISYGYSLCAMPLLSTNI